MAKRFLAIGECLIEMTALGDGSFRQGFAGDTLDTARHLRRALGSGWRVGFCSAVGDDEWSSRILAYLRAEKIDAEHVARLPGRRPGLAIVEPQKTAAGKAAAGGAAAGGAAAGPGGARPGKAASVAYWRDSSAARALADDPDALEAAIAQANAILFSGTTLAILAPDARGQLLTSLGRAKARGASVAFVSNPAPELWPDRGTLRAALRAAARVATVALPRIADETALFAEAGAEALAERYRADGCAEIAAVSGTSALAFWTGGKARLASASAGGIDAAAFDAGYLAARMLGAAPEAAAGAALDAAALGAAGPARRESGVLAS